MTAMVKREIPVTGQFFTFLLDKPDYELVVFKNKDFPALIQIAPAIENRREAR